MEYYKKNNIITSTEFFHKGVRDANDINVYKCSNTGALVLDKVKITDYCNKSLKYWNVKNLKEAREKTFNDDFRRVKLLENIQYESLLDFGCGNGGLLSLLKVKNKDLVGIELNKDIIDILKKENLKVFQNINIQPELHMKKFDCITLFHVLEHLYEPIEILQQLKNKMNNNSVLIIEVPHANDALITYYNCNAFKNFTFWSEHLILHTVESLSILLNKIGFSKINITFEQRYNIFNHLYWLSNGKPGGHKLYSWDDNLINSYNQFLKNNKITDTLIAYCYV